MNPILRLRQAIRSIGAEPDQADEVVDALTDHSFSRRETELMFRHEMALMRQQMEAMRNQILLAVIVVAAAMTTVITVAIAVFD